MPHRYAIYYAPPVEDALWLRACQWTGRDPATDAELPIPEPLRDLGGGLKALTASARRYGFHATLKAPMRLAEGCTETDLRAALGAFAAACPPVPAGPMAPRLLDGFLALMPVEQPEALTEFAAACVSEFEPLRAPLGEAELARRHAADLSDRQSELLDAYGYPYVMEEFRMHMTLTDRLPEAVRTELVAAAAKWFRAVLSAPVTIDRIVLYAEPAPGACFVRTGDFPLLG